MMTETNTPETDLLFQHFATLATGPDGIARLRELILQLAVHGKLGTQDERDEPASLLLERIRKEKERLVKEGKIKASKSLPLVKEGDVLYSIPKGWKIVQFGDVVNYNGRTKTNPEDIPKDAWLLELEDIEKDTSRIVQRLSVGERDPQSTKSSFKTGDVLYGKLRPYLNKVVVAEEDGYCTTEIAPISIYCDILSEYLAYILKSPCFIEYVNSKSYGMKMPRLGTKDAIQAKIPLPPLAEQRRIVEKVDRLMALCDQLEQQQQQERSTCLHLGTASFVGLQNAESPEDFERQWAQICDTFDLMLDCPENVAVLRQTILQLAVQGKLGTQDEGDEAASVLLERIRGEKERLVKEGRIPKDKLSGSNNDDNCNCSLPNSWISVRLGYISNKIHYGYTASAEVLKKNIRLLRITDIQNNRVNWDLVPGCEIDENNYPSYALNVGDLLIARTGGTIGKSYLVEDLPVRAVFASYLIRVVPNKNLNIEYLKIFLESPIYWNQLYQKCMGTGQPNVNGTSLRSLIVPLPPLAEQHRIVEKVDQLMALCDQLEAQLKNRAGVQERFAKAVVGGIAT